GVGGLERDLPRGRGPQDQHQGEDRDRLEADEQGQLQAARVDAQRADLPGNLPRPRDEGEEAHEQDQEQGDQAEAGEVPAQREPRQGEQEPGPGDGQGGGGEGLQGGGNPGGGDEGGELPARVEAAQRRGGTAREVEGQGHGATGGNRKP